MAGLWLIRLLDGVAMGLLYFVVAAGLSITLGTLRVLNLSHGLSYLLGTFLAWTTANHTIASQHANHTGMTQLLLALVLAVPAGGALGATVGLLTWPLLRFGHTTQAIATLGFALAGGQLLDNAAGGTWLTTDAAQTLNPAVPIGQWTYPGYRLWFIAAAIVLGGVLGWLLYRTRTGATARATATEPQMVASLGINPLAVHLTVFAAGTIVAVVAGVLAAPILPGGPGTGEQVLVMSLVIVAVGGAGNLAMAAAAAIGTGLVASLAPGIAPQAAPFTLFAAVLLVLIVRPQGLARQTT